MPVTGLERQIACFSAMGDSIDGRVFLKHIRWIGATTAGHVLLVTDSFGITIFESVSDGSNYIDVFPFYRIVDGLVVSTMQSGKLYAYLG
jgi:hypothetical protein